MLKRLGIKLIPESVIAAYYAADCPPGILDLKAAGIPFGDRVRHRVSRFLRGC